MNKTTKTIKNTEYRSFPTGNGYEIWLVSFATGAKLKRVAKELLTEELADEFIEWVKKRESK